MKDFKKYLQKNPIQKKYNTVIQLLTTERKPCLKLTPLFSFNFFFKPFFDKQALNGFNFALIPQAWTIALELLFYIIAPFIVKRKTIVILFLFTFFIGFKYVLKHQLLLE